MRSSATALAAVLLFLSGPGCSSIMAVRDQQERSAANCGIRGTVSVEGDARGPLVVGLLAKEDDRYRLIDYFVAAQPGSWTFAVEPGTYYLAAFEDVGGDGRYDDEPALRPDATRPIALVAGDRVNDIDLRIARDGRFDQQFALKDLAARDGDEQGRISLFALSVGGTVTTLDDPRFSRETATAGMWKYYDFIFEARPGIYFLEEYDPEKIPVLFVHGIAGTPIDFRPMIENLDRTRFQPWVFYYPSGARVDYTAELLVQLYTRLRLELRFDKSVVVAHSMGGLVTREFLLRDFETNKDTSITTYVTISSPLGGMPSAGTGVRMSPVVVHSWRALAPGSEFLDGLFYRDGVTRSERRRLPAHLAYHMMFGFKGESGDGVVPIASQLPEEAQEEARSVRGFDEDHASILASPIAAAHLNAILAAE